MSLPKAISRTFRQVGDPAFRRVTLLGLGLSLLVFILILIGLIALLPFIPASGINWLDTGIAWLAGLGVPLLFLLVLWLLFPAVMSMIISFCLDDIIDAVEKRHYPDRAGWRRSPVLETLWLALRLSFYIVLVNLLALPLYLALLFTGFGTPILYYLINGYLLGREYFEMAAIRHGTRRDAERMRKDQRDLAFIGGLAIAVLFSIPVVNLIAPVLGIAIMVHLFHARRKGDPVR